MLDIKDGRGQGKSAAGKKNRADIIDFFEINPGSTKTACAGALGLSIITVMRHVKIINGD